MLPLGFDHTRAQDFLFSDAASWLRSYAGPLLQDFLFSDAASWLRSYAGPLLQDFLFSDAASWSGYPRPAQHVRWDFLLCSAIPAALLSEPASDVSAAARYPRPAQHVRRDFLW
eukprot:scaffold7951_cov80-Skeletonema_marinoi.AAC.2